MRKKAEPTEPAGLTCAKMIRIGSTDLRRLRALASKLEQKEAAVWRLALRRLATEEGVE